jgi:hypothetical protein
MVGKPALRGSRFHISPETASLLILPGALALLYLATAGMCFLIHWS